MNAPPSRSDAPSDDASSVLFSLSELMDLESERLAKEEEAAREAERRVAQERREREQREREREEARRRHAERETRRLELERREEEARLAAIADAEIEKARHQAENDARLKHIAQSYEHEERLALIREDRFKRRLRLGLLGTVVAALAALTLGYFWMHGVRREAAERLAEFERRAQEQRRELDEKIRRIHDEKDRISAADQRRRTRLEEELAELRRQRAAVSPGEGKRVAVPSPAHDRPVPIKKPPPPPRCEEGDPMCPL